MFQDDDDDEDVESMFWSIIEPDKLIFLRSESIR